MNSVARSAVGRMSLGLPKCIFLLHIRTGLLAGMPRRHQDMWSRSSPSWYQKDWKPSTSGGEKASDGNAGWSQRDTRSTSSTGQADNTETWEETKDKCLNITPDELWKVQKILSTKRGSLSQTNKKFTEANVKVCDLKQKTMQALSTLAVVYATFEKKAVQTWRLRILSGRCSVLRCLLPWRSLTKPSRTRNACEVS